MQSRNFNPKIAGQKEFSFCRMTNGQISTKSFLFVTAVDWMWKILECYHIWPKALWWKCVYLFYLGEVWRRKIGVSAVILRMLFFNFGQCRREFSKWHT